VEGRRFSKETKPTLATLTLCRAGTAKAGFGARAFTSKRRGHYGLALYPSPREEATWKHEAENRRGETLGGEKARRGSAVGSRVTPAQRVRTYRMHQSLELRLGVSASRETA
jgi:hypothetical protein